MYPECAATEEEGANFDPILSIHVFPKKLARLREAGKAMSLFKKLARETSKFHEDQARRHGVHTPRGLAHFRAAKAYREADTKLMELFGKDGAQLDPKSVATASKDSAKFHKKMAEKHGLDTDEGHAHVAMLQHHMGLINEAKQHQQAQASAHGATGRQVPFQGVPEKSQMKNPDIRQNWKPMVKLQQKEGGPGSGPHPHEGTTEEPEKKKTSIFKPTAWSKDKKAQVGELAKKYGYKQTGDKTWERPSAWSTGEHSDDTHHIHLTKVGWSHLTMDKHGQMKSSNAGRDPKFLADRLEHVHAGSKGQEAGKSQNYVAQRYDKSHPEGFRKDYEASW